MLALNAFVRPRVRRDCASTNLEAVLQLEEQFKAIDKDGSGMISLEVGYC